MKKLVVILAGLLISLSVFAQKYHEPENLNGNWTFYRGKLTTNYNLYAENETVNVPDIFYKDSKGYGTFLRRVYYLEPNTKYAVLMFESPGCNAAAFRGTGYYAVVDVVGGADCAVCERGCDEYHQFYGWHQWHYRGLQSCGYCTCDSCECSGVSQLWCGDDRSYFPECRGAVAAGVLYFQFPPEEQGEVLCRRCGKRGDGVHPAVCHRYADSEDGGCDVFDLPVGVWRGRLPDDLPPHYAARASGGGAPQAYVSADVE